MGCCQSTEAQEEKARNDEIENQLKRDKLNQRNEVKMLLLGNSKCISAVFILIYLYDAPRCGRIGQIDDPKANEIDPR